MSHVVNVLITGGAGLLGAHLTEALLEAGHSAVVYDDLSRPGADRVARRLNALDREGRLRFVFRDVRDESEISRAVHGCDAVFHGAAAGTDEAAELDPALDFRVKVDGMVALMEAVRTRAPRAHVVLPSTTAVYGQAPVLDKRVTIAADERFRTFVRTPADAAALSAESCLLGWAHATGFPGTVLRLAHVYGDETLVEDEGWLARLVRAGVAGQTAVVPVPLAYPIDLVHVRDVARAVVAVLARPGACAGEVLNLGGGMKSAPSLRQLAEAIAEKGVALRIAASASAEHLPFVVDCNRLRSLTGWQPSIAWRDGVARLVAGVTRVRDIAPDEALEPIKSEGVLAWPRAEGLA